MSLRAFVFVIGVFTCGIAHADDHASEFLDVGDWLEAERVSDARISPDGRQIVYTRRYIDKINDRFESSLWIMDSDGERERFLMKGSNPRWSPDGSRLLFTGPDKNGKPQIFVRWMDDEGAVSQVTNVTVTPASPTHCSGEEQVECLHSLATRGREVDQGTSYP